MDYNKQAEEFASKVGLTMVCSFAGRRARFSDRVTAVYRVELSRKGFSFGFEFSTSLNDSWRYYDLTKRSRIQGLPPGLDVDKFSRSPQAHYNGFVFKQWSVEAVNTPPSLYDVLACLTKYDPGSFSNFCADYGYNEDSIMARDTYIAVLEEYHNVERMFHDVMDELAEIN